ncbi:MAG TPA: acyl-CoA thioesterase [Acetomicrobium sp.]|nr:acyl-CoA thioesterase [Acetomicrobium sp.]
MPLSASFVLRVPYGATDQMGVVYYANYLNWFEMGRTEFCRKYGMPYVNWEEKGVFMPVVEVRCRYKHPARYDDLIRIDSYLKEVKPYSLSFEFKVYRDSDGMFLAEGFTKHGFCDKRGKLLKKPKPFYDKLICLLQQ